MHLSPRQPFGWVDFPPAVNRLIGLWWLGKIFYPERFPEDIKALARDFYSFFYHVTPTAAQIDRVLAGGDVIAPASGDAWLSRTLGVVLAGGLARRMGCADKTRIRVGDCDHSRPRHRPARSAVCAA